MFVASNLSKERTLELKFMLWFFLWLRTNEPMNVPHVLSSYVIRCSTEMGLVRILVHENEKLEYSWLRAK